MNKNELHKKDVVYLARILPTTGTYEICELSIRTIEETYFVGIDKRDKHAYLLSYGSLNKTVFKNRKEALGVIKIAENNKPKLKFEESYYEEY